MAKQKSDDSLKSWFDIIYKEPSLKGINLDIEKTLVYRKSRKWEIFLSASQYIPHQTVISLQKKLRNKFSDIDQIKLRFTFKMSLEAIKDNFELIWKDLLELIKKEIPSSTWLTSCSWKWEENSLKIRTDLPSTMDLAAYREIPGRIEEWFGDVFGQKIRVNIITNNNNTAVTKEYFIEKDMEEQKLIKQVAGQTAMANQSHRDEKEHRTNKVILGRAVKDDPEPIDNLREDSGRVSIEACIFDMETRQLRGGKYLISMDVTDYTSSITVKVFASPDKSESILNSLNIDQWYRIRGECQYDIYQKEIVLIATDINAVDSKTRMDTSPDKRIELHAHTHMSAMDGVVSAKALVERAAKWGHSAIAITDHGVVQAFPEAYQAGKKYGIKVIFGIEAYLINDCIPIIQYSRSYSFDDAYVVLDIETTGLDAVNNEIIEIGAIKIHNRKIIDSFNSFVAPVNSIPAHITKLTGITQDMVKDAPAIKTVLPEFFDFCGDAALAAHNASFDINFILQKAKPLGLTFHQPIIDTLALSREMLPELKRYKLNLVAEHLGIPLDNHHRAVDDAKAAGEIMLKLFDMLEKQDVSNLEDVNALFRNRRNLNGLHSYHAIILVKNSIGLKNLYKLVSMSHLEYYYRRPRIPKSLLAQYREGLIIGSACEAGELYQAVIKNQPDDEIGAIVDFYDYLEIQPAGNNQHLIRNGQVLDEEGLREINRRIVALGEKHNKKVVAACDVHFLDPQDEYFRRILMSGQKYEDADIQPPLYFRTTEEMLEEFSYLGRETARRVVIEAPRSIADDIEDIKPIPDKLFAPEIPGAEEEIRSMTMEKAYSIYGKPLPDIVKKRLDKELNSIIGNGYAVLYLIAHKLVKKSNQDGYLVGSRGSVGSSLVATMTGITEVNPLPPHYYCKKCKTSDFDVDSEKYGCGADLPDKICPKCGAEYEKDGFDIPFEVFLGFKGDKVPDIDLNFSGEYQPIAHKYTEELFGEGHVFRAGTIGTIAEKTAYGFVKKYLESKGKAVPSAEIKRLVAGCTGVKRTTGQHPGGILVVPKSRDIHEFTPIQHPADDKESGVITSHFDFHSIHDTLVKLDILGHDDPTVIRMMEDITGVDARKIPLGEDNTMKLFSSTEPLNLSPEDINSQVGTYGIPEFGTKFVRQMLMDTKPNTFAELIRISGLSHGTDVWLNNAQDLIRSNIATLSEVICTRDDIMIYLINRGMDPTMAFRIMESVRKGKGLTPEMEEAMMTHSVPEWYIESCKKIKYMFPKAHAVAYVIMAFRIAWFKVYYPEAFYASYFTVRADDFDADLILNGPDMIRKAIGDLEGKGNNLTPKEKNVLTILEVALEMYMRKLKFVPIDLYKSHSHRFLITEEGIRPPLNALQGVGINAAKNIVAAREQGEFISIEDLRERAKITKTAIESLQEHGVLKNLPETSQISLFSLAFPND